MELLFAAQFFDTLRLRPVAAAGGRSKPFEVPIEILQPFFGKTILCFLAYFFAPKTAPETQISQQFHSA